MQALARLRGRELDQVLDELGPDKRALVLAARDNLLLSEMGYDRLQFKEALADNATLALVHPPHPPLSCPDPPLTAAFHADQFAYVLTSA